MRHASDWLMSTVSGVTSRPGGGQSTIGSGPYVAVVHSAYRDFTSTHRFLTEAGRALFLVCAAQWGYTVKEIRND